MPARSAERSLPLAVTMGDPAGIGPEITLKSYARRADRGLSPFAVYGCPKTLAERARLSAALDGREPFHCFPSDANFLLVQYAGDVRELCRALLDREIAVRQFSSGGPRLRSCIRVTIGTRDENNSVFNLHGKLRGLGGTRLIGS